jgi:hypothetical protein
MVLYDLPVWTYRLELFLAWRGEAEAREKHEISMIGDEELHIDTKETSRTSRLR